MRLFGLATALCLLATHSLADTCPKPDRQPATDKLIALVESDTVLKYELAQSIALGQDINSDPATNPVASLDDYYDFIDALVGLSCSRRSSSRFT